MGGQDRGPHWNLFTTKKPQVVPGTPRQDHPNLGWALLYVLWVFFRLLSLQTQGKSCPRTWMRWVLPPRSLAKKRDKDPS